MTITINTPVTPHPMEWEDIPIGSGAQSVDDPTNIVLKVTHSHGMRLQAWQGNPVLSTQHPGTQSRWYECVAEISFTPAVRAM